MARTLVTCIFLWIAILANCGAADSYKVIHTYPHDRLAFTQGLVYVHGQLYESTGLKGRSSLRMDELETGKLLQQEAVPEQYFAEGLTDWGNTLIQLTWLDHKVFIYDRFSFRLLHTLQYDAEGWGLTHDGKNLILSDGSSTLRFLDPVTWRVVRKIAVVDDRSPVDQLNELEYIHGEIYANVWHSNRIARISPKSGKVLAWIDLTNIVPEEDRSSDSAVLNGIAYDAGHDRLFITGKLWPSLFEIKVLPASKGKVSHPHR